MIFPEDHAGAVVIRDENGDPTNPPNTQNAYVPGPDFVITCPPTALPSDCTARIEPRQINAIVSELLSFAECLDPDGPWNCDTQQNLCNAFSAWVALNYLIYIGDAPPVDPKDNQLWWESDTGMLFIWYDDGNGNPQWVQVVAGNSVIMDGISIVGEGSTAEPYQVGLIDCGSW